MPDRDQPNGIAIFEQPDQVVLAKTTVGRVTPESKLIL